MNVYTEQTNTQYTLLFVIHIVLGCNTLDLIVGPQLLNICQSAKGKSSSGGGRCIIIENQTFIHYLSAKQLAC